MQCDPDIDLYKRTKERIREIEAEILRYELHEIPCRDNRLKLLLLRNTLHANLDLLKLRGFDTYLKQ